MMFNVIATNMLNTLPRIAPNQVSLEHLEKVLLCPKDVELQYLENNRIRSKGLQELDLKERDLIRKIEIHDPLSMEYSSTNILMLRTFAESLDVIPEHISVQAIILSRVDKHNIGKISDLIRYVQYSARPYDQIWIEKVKFTPTLLENQYVFIMNRRVGGWDGSRDKPVIELLGAGGHLPDVWSSEENDFITVDKKIQLANELEEELGLNIREDEVSLLGGFHNTTSNELVILGCCFINCALIPQIYEKSSNNLSEDTDGIYLGRFNNVIEQYLDDATYFAGGNKAKPTNFPSQKSLMREVYKLLNNKDNS